MKHICIKVAGSDRPLIDRKIEPATTAGEILADIGLPGYLLSAGPRSDRFFAEDENVYAQVSDGDKLYATTPAEVGDSTGLKAAHLVRHLGEARLPLPFNFVKRLLTIRHRATVKRSATTFLEQQGWKLINAWPDAQWVGYYRTRLGSFKGKVENLSNPCFYIHKPPEELHKHSHWACFSDSGSGWYRVHFRKMPKELDSGLMCILRILREALRV